MLRYCSFIAFCLLFFYSTCLQAANSSPAFSLHKLGPKEENSKTLLVIGGIQGDEPGGFHAASILTTHYTISKGDIWVVPNLNFLSIINRSRGVHGDLNRKFAAINKSDPEFIVVERIKSIILDEKVDVVLNLHDGSGFYNPLYIDKLNNPNRWGQSIIIDQEQISAPEFGDLNSIAQNVAHNVNSTIIENNFSYRVKNTETASGNTEMAKTLTYFAITNKKPAFGVEASKTLSKPERVFYHLLVLENFMTEMGIEFNRHFELTAANIKTVIKENRNIAFYDNRIFMEMQNIRRKLNYFPIQRSGELDFMTSNPLIAVVEKSNHYDIYHGNEHITTLVPEFFDYDIIPPSIGIEIDGTVRSVKMGEVIQVSNSFKIMPHSGYRANAIGFVSPKGSNESGIHIKQTDFTKRFSLNTLGNIFRVEFYKTDDTTKGDKFAGMVLVKFDSNTMDNRLAEAPSSTYTTSDQSR